MVDAGILRIQLSGVAPSLVPAVAALCEKWTKPLLARLEANDKPSFPKTFNDPVWGAITLLPHEVLLLDSPLLQRLRGVRQLGMAHLVYPGAGHGRLEHIRGVVQAAQRMIDALTLNATYRRIYGRDPDHAIPVPSDLDRVAVRIGALLHDIGHGPFSHATEPLIKNRHEAEFKAVDKLLRERFEGVTSIAPSESFAVLVVMSEAMRKVFEHPNLGAIQTPAKLAPAVAARILGSRSCLDATYLSGVISGPIDADKLDYMARDCHHAGLPLGLDINRLIHKLEVVSVTPENAPNDSLKTRAELTTNRRFYEIGISLAGLGAYEQMIIARAILYDRIYHHHKVRCAEALVRKLIALAEQDRGAPFTLGELITNSSDDVMVEAWGGSSDGSPRAMLAEALQNRNIYHRAYTFAARFIDGLDNLSEKDRYDTRALKWGRFVNDLSKASICTDFEKGIYQLAVRIAEEISELKCDDFRPEHVIVDMPINKAVVRGSDILTMTEDGHLGLPNLFFDPERWSQAYEAQKQSGYVFAPRAALPLVNLAAKILLCERYDLVLKDAADHAAKATSQPVSSEWIAQLAKKGLCTAETAAAFTNTDRTLITLKPEDVRPPDAWNQLDPMFRSRIADAFREIRPSGFIESIHRNLGTLLEAMTAFVDCVEKQGLFVGRVEKPEESELQAELLKFLRARDLSPQEGAKVGGGITDVVLDKIVIENKVRGPTADPHKAGENADWQARRYSIATCASVQCTLIAYKPTNEKALLPLPARLEVVERDMEVVQIRVVLPWGQPVPSDAKAP